MSKKIQRSSTNAEKHDYLKVTFWQRNQFWETDMYSEKSKQYFREWLNNMIAKERRLTSF